MDIPKIDKADIINCESWKSLCDYDYTGQDDLPTGIIHCDIASITSLFDKIRYNGEKYIVISSRADFGLHLQLEYPPWKDYHKAVDMFVSPENSGYGYRSISCPPRLNVDKCKQYDKYSIKCYSFTDSTFDSIPHNVGHWFLTNNTVVDDKLTTIPFGINGTDGNTEGTDSIYDYISNNSRPDRMYDLYVNFQFYTNERLSLYKAYRNSPQKLGIVERDIPYDKFLERLFTHKFVLCPTGNGIDCFRTLEAIYMGCVPILEMHPGLLFYYNQLRLPVIHTGNMFGVNKVELNSALLTMNNLEYNFDSVRLSCWKKRVDDCAEELLN